MQQVLVGESPTGFGWDYTFDCTGNTDVMRAALEAAHRGWGQCCIIGVAASGKEIATRPFQFITGRRCCGTAFGGWETRDAVPLLVNKALRGEIPVDHFITHRFNGVAGTLKAIEALHSGDRLRAAVDHTSQRSGVEGAHAGRVPRGRHSRSAVPAFVRRSCLRGGEHNPARFYYGRCRIIHMLVSSCSAPGASNRRRVKLRPE